MIWSQWVYLVIGLGLGIGGHWLWGLRRSPDRDVTPVDKQEVLALQQQLRQSQTAYQLAQKMSQFKAGFLARAAHELRSPLNSLIGLHQLILADLCDDPAEERTFVAQANQSALKLMELMNEVIEVSGLEHGTCRLEIQPVNLAQILTEVYNSTHLIAANRNLRLHLSLPTVETYVLADPRWLRQVFINILDICFTQMQEGKIALSTQLNLTSAEAQIWLDSELPERIWTESADADQLGCTPPSEANFTFSPGMTLLLTQTLLNLMHCHLEILPLSDGDPTLQTRVQLTIPLALPESEAASLESIEN